MLPLIPIVLGVGAITVGAAAPLLRRRSRRHEMDAAKAGARAVYHRLGFCVETVDAGADAAAVEAMRRAEERWHTTGALLADADTVEECRVAEQTAREGLRHVADAGKRLGIEPPEVPGAAR